MILIAYNVNNSFPLVIAANRDEFFARPTAPLHFWEDKPDILAGRDLSGGGTWMGVTRQGRFAALTNFREPEKSLANPPTRGELVSNFLAGSMSTPEYLAVLADKSSAYNGFNLICGHLTEGLWHFSNRNDAPACLQPLTAGIYGLSNHLLDTPWPKVARGKSALAMAVNALPSESPLFGLLRDENIHEDKTLPRTGISLEWERMLSAAFVRAPDYGTRCCSVLSLDQHEFVTFDEQTWLAGACPGHRQRYRFKLAG